MRCKTCDYRLWNLRSRTCPECGTPFRPSDYEFVPNSVQFVCPHCGQRYYGTGDAGHLVPPEFDCVHCGRHIHMDEMVLLPTTGVEEEQTAPDLMPWLERTKRGFVRSWLSSVGWALVRPGRLIRSVPIESSLLEAWWFTILVHLPVVLVAAAPLLFLPLALPAPGFRLRFVFAFVSITAPFGLAVLIGLWGAVTHLVLWVLAKPAAGPRRTYQALCYSAGANVFTALPCLGFYFGWIWWLVSAVVMVKVGQRVSAWRASVAVLLLPALGIAAFVGFYVYLFMVILPSLPASFTQPPAGPAKQTQAVLDSVLGHAWVHDGQGPDHAIRLLLTLELTADQVLSRDSRTSADDVPMADVTLDRFLELSPQERAAVARAVAEALPEGTAVHRLGDLVFTYHGIDLENCDPRLWLVVLLFDPDVNEVVTPDGFVYVGLADQTVIAISIETLPAKLAEQNVIRQAYDLPPLPDPTQVTHVRPPAD